MKIPKYKIGDVVILKTTKATGRVSVFPEESTYFQAVIKEACFAKEQKIWVYEYGQSMRTRVVFEDEIICKL